MAANPSTGEVPQPVDIKSVCRTILVLFTFLCTEPRSTP